MVSHAKGERVNPEVPQGTFKKGLRTGFTTGACAAGAARAAVRMLRCPELVPAELTKIALTLPNGQPAEFALHRVARESGGQVLCSIIKDGGDDPDCTHGAEIVAEVRLVDPPAEGPARGCESEVILKGGQGVATVTKPGLGLEVGGPAINPVPRRHITEMVLTEWADCPPARFEVTISVPDGEERAKKTLNARLGLLGGISILGTTGIVLPYSTSAFITSIVQAIALAARQGVQELVFTTGGRSETYGMKLLPHLPEQAFIQVGDYIGIGIKQAIRQGITLVHIVGMMGKLSKMADGQMMTHASHSEVNMGLLASMAQDLGASIQVVEEIRGANTARHVLEICSAHGLLEITHALCALAGSRCHRFSKEKVRFDVAMVDFNGALLGRAFIGDAQ